MHPTVAKSLTTAEPVAWEEPLKGAAKVTLSHRLVLVVPLQIKLWVIVFSPVFFELFPDVFFCLFSINSNCSYKVTSAPEAFLGDI